MLVRNVDVVLTEDRLQAVVDHYSQVDEFVIDVETVGEGDHRKDPRRNDVLWVGLATEGRSDVIPLGHPNGDLVEIKRGVLTSGVRRLHEGKDLRRSDLSKAEARARKVFAEPPEQLLPGQVFAALKPVLFDDSIRKIGANVKFDLESIAKYYGGQVPPPPYGDVLVADYLLDDTNQNQMNLAAVVKRRLGYNMPKGIGKKVEDHSLADVARYSHGDVKFTWMVWKVLQKQLQADGLHNVFQLEMDCLEAIMAMEQRGTLIDVEQMTMLSEELQSALVAKKAEAFRIAGGPFNINSTEDKKRLLFTPEGRNLKPRVFTKKTKEPAVSEEALSHFSSDPLVRALMEIAELRKLESTYVTPYLGGEVERTTGGKTKISYRESLLLSGRVHTNFKQHGTVTGRFSSSGPNLQNIPSRGEIGQRIRGMFIADPGHVLVCADYAQIEPRLMASLSGDQVLINTFVSGGDIYQVIADELGVDRKAGKVLVLAMAYGIGPSKIAADLSLTLNHAQNLLDSFERQFPVLARYKKKVIRDAAARRPVPYVPTILGRRRRIPWLLSRSKELRAKGQRQAFNSRIQGSAADVMKIAIVRAQAMLPPGASLLLTVHDELVASCPSDITEESVAALREAMEGIDLPQIKVPLKVDIGTGLSWSEAK